MTKMLGLIIAGGLSSENRVFATLLAERGEGYEARVMMHQSGVDGTTERFAELSRNPTAAYDTGWRTSPYSRRGNPLRAWTAARYLRNIEVLIADARDYAPDIIYSSQQHVDCRAASKISANIAVPQVVHLHYNIGPWLRRPVLRRLRTTDLVIAVSDFIREQAIDHGLDEARVVTLHNAVAPLPPPDRERNRRLRRELGLPDDAFTIGMVSRIDEGKGHFDAIAAFEQLASEHDDARLVIVGSGRIDREVRRRINSSAVANQIISTGFRTDVDDLLGVFDTLMHPALQDPCPLAVLEAMSAGLPVLGYDDGGVPELVESGVTGLLTDSGDVPQLAEALRTVYFDQAFAQRLGTAGRRRLACRFTPARAGQQFAEIIASAG